MSAVDEPDGGRFGQPLAAQIDCADEFDPSFYLETYPDIAGADITPLEHYLTYGWREERDPSPRFVTREYKALHPEAVRFASPLMHYRQARVQWFTPRSTLEHVAGRLTALSGMEFGQAEHLIERLRRARPWLLLDALNPDYLMKYMSDEQRLDCLSFNIAFLCWRLGEGGLDGMTADVGLPLFDNGVCTLSLVLAPAGLREGDLSLQLRVEGVRTYELAFNFVDESRITGTGDARAVALVTKLQGFRGQLEAGKAASDSLGGVEAPLALLAACEGVGAALSASSIYGVSCSRQVSYRASRHADFERAYDHWYARHGGRPAGEGFWRLGDLQSERLTAADSRHRRRARKRRQARRCISEAARAAMAKHLRTPEAAIIRYAARRPR